MRAIKKYPVRRLTRVLRDAYRLEPMEPRVLLSADPVLGAAQAILIPNIDHDQALLGAYDLDDAHQYHDLVTPALKANFAYDVQISGRHGVGPLDRGVAMGDAAYYPAFNDIDVVHYPFSAGNPGSDTWVTGWDGVANRRPSVDGYQPTHIYDYFIQGRGAGLTFTFRDSPYSDNVGGETVSIYELGELVSPTTVPEPSTVVLLAAGLLGIGVAARTHRQSV